MNAIVKSRCFPRNFVKKQGMWTEDSATKEVKSTVRQSVEMKSKQLTIQHNTQDHPQTAENDTRKKLKVVQDSGDPLIIPSVFGSGTVTVNPGVVRYLDASHDLDDQLQALEEKYGLKSHRNGCVLTLSGQADDLLSSANLLLHDIKGVPNEDKETKMPHKCQDEFLNAWKNREVEGSSALEPDKTDVPPSSFPSKKDLSPIDQENSLVYMEYKTEVAEDVLKSIKITSGQKGIDSLISDLDQFAKVEMYEGRVIVFCDYKYVENVQRCVKSHYEKAKEERKIKEENKHLIPGESDNHMEWLQFAYGHTSWYKNLQLEGGKLYLTGTLQMKKEAETAVYSMTQWYEEKVTLSTEKQQQKADEIVTLVKSELPSVFIKRIGETIIVSLDNRDNFERAKYKVNEALDRIKITARGKRHTDPQLHSESLSGMTADYKMSANPKCSSTTIQKNQSAAVLTPKYYYTKEGLTAKVYLGNIKSLPVDCIVVVAENGFLWHGAGVSLAISKAAGRDFEQEREAYVRKNGAVPVTHCCITSAGRLPYRVLIHAVGPKWSDYNDDEKDRYVSDLKKTIVNCLIEANKFKMVSIAIPPLSSGIFGVPKELCAKMYAKGVVEYSKTYGLQSLKEIHFVDTVSEMCQLTWSAFDRELQNR
ncbi:hypothetical protein CHS0354_016668 [Potamilus streckersoni]|uniref:Macro domain-containing protein n=1 Tax=Potamilus streckersoni TaxID=2493646 RepID=A0AAE0THD7_9BIVA|nr:hypothetical protein CHS0354_016668 [Potamilus streckersoni]